MWRQLGLTVVTAAMLASCAEEPEGIGIDNAWVRMPAAVDRPAAGYFTLRGGPADDRLIEITSPMVIRIELHESKQQGGMMTMAKLDSVALPANGTVEFKPGGKHIMLFNINPGVKPPARLPLIFTFASGTRLQTTATLRTAAEAGGEHEGH